MKCDHIKRLITLTSDYIKLLSLYFTNICIHCIDHGNGLKQKNISFIQIFRRIFERKEELDVQPKKMSQWSVFKG